VKFADPQPLSGPVDVTLPHGFTGDVERLRADLAAMGLDVRGAKREDPPPAEGEPRVTLTSGPGAEGAVVTTPDTAPTPAEIADAYVVIRDFAEAFDAMEARVGGLAREGAAEIRELAEQLARLPADPHLAAAIEARVRMPALTVTEERAARRRFERVARGGCPCGEATGESACPWCDDDTLPEDMRAAGAALRQREATRGKLDVEAVVKALAPKPQPLQPHAARSPNRHERRRAASRRWRG